MTFDGLERMFAPYVGMTLVGLVELEGGRMTEVCFEDPESGHTYLLTFWQQGSYHHGGMNRMWGLTGDYVKRHARHARTVTERTEPAED